MSSNKLGCGVYIRPEHRAYRSAKLGPSVNISNWDERINAISPKHYFGDMRPYSWWHIPLTMVALVHYYNNSETLHHSFTLLNGSDIYVVRQGNNDEDVRFLTYSTGTSDQEYADEHMTTDMNLKQTQCLVMGISTREGFLCIRCKNPDCLVPSFKHRINVNQRMLSDAAIVDALIDKMKLFNDELKQLRCTMDPKTCRITAEVEENNLYAGACCVRRADNRATEVRTVFRRDPNNILPLSMPVSLKRKAEEDDTFFDDIDVDQLQKDAEEQSEKKEDESAEACADKESDKTDTKLKKNEKYGKSVRDIWLRLKVPKKRVDDFEAKEKDALEDSSSVGESSTSSYLQVQYENNKIREFERELVEEAAKFGTDHATPTTLSSTLDLIEDVAKATQDAQDPKPPKKNKRFKASDNEDERSKEVD